MNKATWAAILILVLIALGAFFLLRYHPFGGPAAISGGTVRIVAAENFYGSVAAQIAGSAGTVQSIISNPDVDPHEYDATVQDGVAVADADIVIRNGLHYDGWMDKLIAASPNPARIEIAADAIAPVTLPENPHLWYSVDDVAAVARAIEVALVEKDPADAAVFAANRDAFDASLDALRAKMADIKARHGGAPVALTETIYLYETQTMGLDVRTPISFERAIAEGNDPSARDVNDANREIADRLVRVLIYNSQTVTPITTDLQTAAREKGIPVVPVTETMPQGVMYQQWISGELDALAAALEQGQQPQSTVH